MDFLDPFSKSFDNFLDSQCYAAPYRRYCYVAFWPPAIMPTATAILILDGHACKHININLTLEFHELLHRILFFSKGIMEVLILDWIIPYGN